MKKRFSLVLILTLTAVILGGCAMGPRADSVPGLSADENAVYVSYQQYVYKVDSTTGTELWRYPSAASAQVVFYAPPLIFDGKFYVGDLANKFHQILAENGSEAWTFSEAKGWFEAKAATDGTYVIAPNLDRSVYCLNTDGTLKWTYTSEFGFLAEPVIIGDVVYISSLDRNLVALDKASGEVLWKTELNGAIISAPYYDAASDTLFVGSLGKEMVALDRQTGEMKWKFDNKGELSSIWSSPVVADGNLLFLDETGKIFALNPEDGSVIWTMDAGGNTTAGILTFEENFLIAREDGTLTAYKLSDRSQLWNKPTNGQVYTTPIFADGKIFIGIKGDTLLQAYEPNGNLLWSFTPGK